MSPSPFLLVSWGVVLALAALGRQPERWAAALFAALLAVTPAIDHYVVGNIRWAVAASSLLAFVALLWLALTRDRWWLVFAAGCQLLALSTHVISLLRLDSLLWTAVTLRWVSWAAVLATAVFGIWEAHALERLRRRSQQRTDSDRHVAASHAITRTPGRP